LKTSFNNWRRWRRKESSTVRWTQEWPKVLELERGIINLSEDLENERERKTTFVTQAEASFRDKSKLEEEVKQKEEQLMESQKERTDLEGRLAKKPTELLLEAVTRRLGGARKELDDLEKNLDHLACEGAQPSVEKVGCGEINRTLALIPIQEQRLLLQHKIKTRTGEVSKLEEILQSGGGGQLETIFNKMVKYYVDAIDGRTSTLIKKANSTEIRAQKKLKNLQNLQKQKDVSVAEAEKTSADRLEDKGRQLTELYDQKQQIEESLKQTQEDLSRTKAEVEKLRDKSQSLNRVVEEKEGETTKLREELQSSEKKVRALSRAARKAKRNRHASPEDRHVALELKDEERKLRYERQSELEHKLQQLTNDIEEQTRQLNDLHSEHRDNKRTMAAEIRKQQTLFKEAKENESQKQSKIRALEDQLRDLNDEIEEAKGKLTSLRAEQSGIEKNVQRSEAKLRDLKKSEEDSQIEIESRNKELEDLEEIKKELANDIKRTEEVLTKLRAKRFETDKKVKKSEARLGDLEKSEKESRIEIESRNKELEEDLEETKEELANDIKMAEEVLTKLRAKRSETDNKVKESEARLGDLEKSKKESRIEIESRKKELRDLEQTKQQLAAEISGKKNELQSQSEELRKAKNQVSSPKRKQIKAESMPHLLQAEELLAQLVSRGGASGISLIDQLEAKLRVLGKSLEGQRPAQQLEQASECLQEITGAGKAADSTHHERSLAVCQTLDRLAQAMTILGDLESSTCEEDWDLVKKLLSDIMEVYQGPELNLRAIFPAYKELLDRHFGSRGQSREEIDTRWESALAGVEGRYTECTQRAESPVRAAINRQNRQERLFNESEDDEMGQVSDESLSPVTAALRPRECQSRALDEHQVLEALGKKSIISALNPASSKKQTKSKRRGPKASSPRKVAAQTARSAAKVQKRAPTELRRSGRQTKPIDRLVVGKK
jgi:septal ring factor EnvC (AmiA/AmiB activator)